MSSEELAQPTTKIEMNLEETQQSVEPTINTNRPPPKTVTNLTNLVEMTKFEMDSGETREDGDMMDDDEEDDDEEDDDEMDDDDDEDDDDLDEEEKKREKKSAKAAAEHEKLRRRLPVSVKELIDYHSSNGKSIKEIVNRINMVCRPDEKVSYGVSLSVHPKLI